MTLPNTSSLTTGPGSPLEGATGPRAGRALLRGTGKWLWPTICLFQVGLFAGLYTSWSGRAGTQRPDSGEHPSSSDERHEAGSTATDSPVRTALPAIADQTRGDELLRRGWYERALQHYAGGPGAATDDLPLPLRFRVALCLEGLGKWDRALAEYLETASRGAGAPVSCAARLAHARLWLKLRKPDEAQNGLAELLLAGHSRRAFSQRHQQELQQLLGLCLAQAVLGPPPGPRRSSALATATPDWQPESLLIWSDLPADPDDTATADEASPPVAQFLPHSASITEGEVALSPQFGGLSAVVERVARAAGLRCQWTGLSGTIAERRIVDVDGIRLPWPVLLTALLEPQGIAWETSPGILRLTAQADLDEDQRRARRAESARAILESSLRDSSGANDGATARLTLGNLAFATGSASAAAEWFEQFLRRTPRSPLAVLAHYNLGVVQRSRGDGEAARRSFLNAADAAPTHVLAPLAHLGAGRTHLDEFDPAGAIAPLRRAASQSAGAEARPAAAIDLATALLLTGNWRGGAAALAEHRAALDEPLYREAAAFLNAYVRLHAQSDRLERRRQGEALLLALRALPSESVLHPSAIILIGRAQGDLGLHEQMAATFDEALRRGVPQPLAQEIRLELAECARLAGADDDATEHLMAVFRSGQDGRSRRAGLRIAEMALADQQPASCLDTCRRLLASEDQPDLPDVLRLMGQAYEQSGDLRRAAECYAGNVPPAEVPESP